MNKQDDFTNSTRKFSNSPVDVTFYTPNRIERTDQYEARRDRFYKWRELKSE